MISEGDDFIVYVLWNFIILYTSLTFISWLAFCIRNTKDILRFWVVVLFFPRENLLLFWLLICWVPYTIQGGLHSSKGLLYFHLIFTLMVLSSHRSKQKPEEFSMHDPSSLADSELQLSLTNTMRILKSLLSFSASKLFQ